eukprot:CAMPEP_0116833006 /NCGR_PEP_ID=MMETSP0418-20121206/6201_1 /TAXON_ID=1158023 /ORGANISM="Astrosyne radiata, Strain 13vi08-1A" /LENGTH=123 /DNA_ID=CAMNT_0004462417 /DNA_START=22 /DNA_END=393 /DNA_ORIENTATION=+
MMWWARPSTTAVASRVGSTLSSSSRVYLNASRARFVSGYDTSVKNPSDYTLTGKPSEYSLGKHRSNALELIKAQPIIEVDAEMAICDGGGGALGHPIEYISLEYPGEIKECIYCGTRFKRREH